MTRNLESRDIYGGGDHGDDSTSTGKGAWHSRPHREPTVPVLWNLRGGTTVNKAERAEVGALLRSPPTLMAPCLLLLLGECPGHGYELVVRLRDFGFSETTAGGVYRELRRLEEAGLIISSWQATQVRGPARRVYELTSSGDDALRTCAESADHLSRTLQGYRRRARAAGGRRAVWVREG